MERMLPCINVYAGPRPEQGPGPIISYCANAVPCTVPLPIQCEYTISIEIIEFMTTRFEVTVDIV